MSGESEGVDKLHQNDIAKQVATLVQQAKALQSAGSSFSARLRVEEQTLSQQAAALEKEIRHLRSDVFSALDKGGLSTELAEKLEEDIERAFSMIREGDVGALLPPKDSGRFLKMLLGPVNVKATATDVRFKAKEEYNTYRDRTAVLFLLFPCLLLLSEDWIWHGCFPALPVQAYQAWLLFFYTSLAVRENVLRINGSNIRSWWVYHHYCAMLMAIVALTWDIRGHYPDCKKKQRGVHLFLIWAVMQGGTMLLQNRYQRQRLYTRIALGKAGRMDVVWGEAGVFGQLSLLYPLLFLLQACQCVLGALFVRTAFLKDSEWQVVGCGVLLLVMAVGNFLNTLETLVAKMRIKSRMKSKSLLHGTTGKRL